MIIKDLSVLAENLLEIYSDFVELSDDWNLDHTEIRDAIKTLAGAIIDEAEKLIQLEY